MTPKKNNQEYDEEIEIDNLKENKAAEADTEDNEPIEVVKASAKSNASTMDFDWDNVSNKRGTNYSADERQALEAKYDTTLSTITANQVVEGTVIAKNSREVVVSVGYKSEGVIPMNEFRYNPDIQVGDTVEVFVENQEDKNGSLVLSHKKARSLKSWDRVNEALANNEIIKGYIKCRTKGGMIVDVFGIEAFLPGSQIDVKPFLLFFAKIQTFSYTSKKNGDFFVLAKKHLCGSFAIHPNQTR